MELIEAIDTAEKFEIDQKKFGYDISYPEFNFSRGRKNYNTIINRLKNLDLPNPATFKYSHLSLEELTTYLSTILNKIFDNQYAEQIEEYNGIIELHPISNPFDAALQTTIEWGTPQIKKIHISKELASIQVVATAHEYIHALLAKYSTFLYNQVLSNYHYNELLSLLIEYITVYELSNLFKGERLEDKHNIIRLHTDRSHILASEENKAFEPIVKARNYPVPYQLYKKCLDHAEHIDFGYITSDVYATRLFELYKDDPKTLLSIYKAIIDGEKSINDLLKYYGIALNDKNTVNSFYKRLDNVPKL